MSREDRTIINFCTDVALLEDTYNNTTEPHGECSLTMELADGTHLLYNRKYRRHGEIAASKGPYTHRISVYDPEYVAEDIKLLRDRFDDLPWLVRIAWRITGPAYKSAYEANQLR